MPDDFQVMFVPKEDITAYELAVLVQHGGFPHSQARKYITPKTWDEIPEGVRRHLKRMDLKEDNNGVH